MMSKRRSIPATVVVLGLLTGLGLAGLGLGGCAVGPDYVRPELETQVPDAWAGQEAEPATDQPVATMQEALADTAGADHWRWWEAFDDAELNELVEASLQYNNDLAAAAGRVLEAEALYGGAKANQWPTVEIGGVTQRSKASEDLTGGFGSPYSTVNSLSATARYEIDLWGRLSRGKEAALTTLLASEEDRRALAQSLIAGVVRTWLQIREFELQVDLNERTVASLEQSLATVHDRYRRGLVTALDVHLARQNLAAAQSAGPTFRQELNAARRRLEILAGRYPGGRTLADGDQPTAFPDPLPAVPAGLPSQLLERRPDLRAAEYRLHSSVARIGEAKALLYPRISLTAGGGTSSDELKNLFTSGTDIWSLAGNLFMPLINRGATQAQIKAAEARMIQATAGYRATILDAFSEVENALDSDRFQLDQEVFLTDSVEQARRSVNLAEDRYARGLDSLLVTLESQRRLYSAESQLLSTQRARRSARVELILALGGPWENLAPDSTTPVSVSVTHEGDQP